jgi:hypothetical protein
MTLIVRPGFQFDTDASTYIEAVEVADTQALETATRYAINNFVIGCKQDGIWSAIKASCILSGARTLAGALIPLAGTAPTNNNFVSGDYNRKTGLVGDGSTKYLAANRANNADPQDSKHLSAYLSATTTGAKCPIGSGGAVASNSQIVQNTAGSGVTFRINFTSGASATTSDMGTGLVAASRATSASVNWRMSGVSGIYTDTSQAPASNTIDVFRRSGGTLYSDQRLAFYSIGESLNLAALDARVSALITAFGAAIP